MKTTFYPTLEEALYLHQVLLEEFGGSAGVLDYGLLESALARPRSGYYKTLAEQAAALLHSLALNHPFVDGNKRVAVALTAVFLRLNGFALKTSTSEGREFIEEQLIAGKLEFTKVTAWLEKRMLPL